MISFILWTVLVLFLVGLVVTVVAGEDPTSTEAYARQRAWERFNADWPDLNKFK